MTQTEAKSRNKRWRVTAQETSFLEAVFLRTRKPSRATIDHLAKSLNVRPRQVQVWFQNRRQRWRKEFSTAPTSPTDGTVQDGDNVQPDSLDAIMRQFIDVSARDGEVDNAGDESDAVSSPKSEEADDASEEPGPDVMGSTMLEDISPWATAATFISRPGAAAQDEVYLDNLTSLIDLSAAGAMDSKTASTADEGDADDAHKSWIGMDWFIDDSAEYASPEKGAVEAPTADVKQHPKVGPPAALQRYGSETTSLTVSGDTSPVQLPSPDLLTLDVNTAKAAEIASYLEGVCSVLAI